MEFSTHSNHSQVLCL